MNINSLKKIILIGAGGHAKSCIDVIESTNQYEIIGLFDIKEKIGEKLFNYPIIDCDENIKKYINNDTYFLITIGQIATAAKRKYLFEILKNNNALIPKIISPYAYVSKYAKIQEGTIVMHNAFVNAGVEIGKNCIINTKSHIEHDVKIGNHCHISTSSVINGDCIIGNEVFIGSNSTIIQGIKISDKTFVKAGSVSK